MRTPALLATLALVTGACAASQHTDRAAASPANGASATPAASGVAAAAATITEGDIRRRIGIIADDSMMGRNTPSPGLEKTAAYIASEFRRFGLKPAGDGGDFLQRYPLPVRPAQSAAGSAPVAPVTAPNVVGILEGSDPVLKHEYIVFSAHMDHVGVGTPVNGDSIYNGADDDASGTAAVIELAEAFTRPGARPKRSLIFLTVSGEEHGLWGSEWFAAHPPVPVAALVANINIDMVGRNWKDTIVVIGKEHSDLGATLERVNAAHPELGMRAIDDIWPQEQFYFRSDHYNFARKGVPILFFFNGTHPDYHAPGDEPSKIDAEKEARIVKLIFYIGHDLATAPARPQWKPESYRKIVGPR